jgi:hypothetical protein
MRSIRFLLALLVLAIPAALFGQIGIRVSIGPPALPMYDQPACPGDGYMWTPGYWAYDDSISDYYWVPGTWELAPEEGYLWTPGYWGWDDGGYFFNDGYWGATVGFYGGINYGFGYFGDGYYGGRWDNGHFFYNSSYNNLNGGNFHNTYDARADNGNNDSRVSYNGGKGGVAVRPSSQQEAAARQNHFQPVAAQTEHEQAARANPQQRAGNNHGNPGIAATSKPGDFSQQHSGGVAMGAATSRNQNGGRETVARAAVHPNDLAPIARPAPVNSGHKRADRNYEAKQDELIASQNQDRHDLQQKQDAEHAEKPDPNNWKMEQKHQQQTQKMVEKHSSQQQELQSHSPQPRSSQSESRR